MRHVIRLVLGLAMGLGILFAVSAADEAQAQCGGGCTPPPPCCASPALPPGGTPPAPPPTTPSQPCCAPPGHSINVPGVNVQVNASVIVNANVNTVVNAQAGAAASGYGSGNATTVFYGGGGYSGGFAPYPQSMIQGLNVEGGR
mgnify:CR=1 FL=1